MNVRNLSSLLLSLLTLVVLGCGGGGGDASPAPVSTTLSGEAFKGPIVDGDVHIFKIDENGTVQSEIPTLNGPIKTKAFGNYSAVINYEGPVKVVVTGGKYEDEATKLQLDNISLSAVVANVSGSAKVSVTPFTEMAVQKAEKTENKFTSANIKAANTAVAIALGLKGVDGLPDVDIVEATPSTTFAYKSKLAVFSQAVLNQARASHSSDPTSTPDDVKTLLADMASGIDISTGNKTEDFKTKIDFATTEAFKNEKINEPGKDPLIIGSAVSRVDITEFPSTNPAVNANVKISATVKTASGGFPAAGTAVTFTASSGAFSDVTTTNNEGVATATLSGITSPQTVSITASAGNVKSTEININFVDKDSPSVISVTDAPVDHFINNPVTLAIKVVSAEGTVPVPLGTEVLFEITPSVTGATLSANKSTTDANGNATVTLNSTVDGVVTVKITAAQATGSHNITFNDPNKPGSIKLIANRDTGFTKNLVPVILTATVTPKNIETGTIADGTPVTFTIVSGTGADFSPASVTTSGGVATVTLNCTVEGIVVVNAKAGSTPPVTSSPVSVSFINQPTQVSVKVRTTGTLPTGTSIGGLKATVTANPSSGLSIIADPNGNSPDVSATGAGAGSQIITNSNNVAAVTLALVNTNGIKTGEFATVNYNVAAGSFPKVSDFTITLNGSVIDTLSAPIPLSAGIGVDILSVTIQ